MQKVTPDEQARRQRLMELVEAEDAANGEVGCGRRLDKAVSEHFSVAKSAFDPEELKHLLQEHLGHILTEADFDSIATQIEHQFGLLLINRPISSPNSSTTPSDFLEHIPTTALTAFLQSQLTEFDLEGRIDHLLQFSHHVIHQAVRHPRHTWAKPIWILEGQNQLYIVQAGSMEEAIAQVKQQYPQEAEALTVVKVGGVLAPNQVITLG